jgi:hypothetical protein
MLLYLSIVEMAKSSYLFGFVEDVGVNLKAAHDVELFKVFEEVLAGDGCVEGHWVFGEQMVEGFALGNLNDTRETDACATVEKHQVELLISFIIW